MVSLMFTITILFIFITILRQKTEETDPRKYILTKKRHHAVMAAYGPNEPWKRLDHYDGDPQNNHIENLKIATAQSDASVKQVRNHRRTSSRKNNKSGYEGLALHKILNGVGKCHGMSLLKYKEDER